MPPLVQSLSKFWGRQVRVRAGSGLPHSQFQASGHAVKMSAGLPVHWRNSEHRWGYSPKLRRYIPCVETGLDFAQREGLYPSIYACAQGEIHPCTSSGSDRIDVMLDRRESYVCGKLVVPGVKYIHSPKSSCVAPALVVQ